MVTTLEFLNHMDAMNLSTDCNARPLAFEIDDSET
ncbi:MAG: hypothetical protein QOH67_1426 [Hyphomicrobiales bacterium]|nr:hypothetical protein [Hyphomicrobiales bacterium]